MSKSNLSVCCCSDTIIPSSTECGTVSHVNRTKNITAFTTSRDAFERMRKHYKERDFDSINKMVSDGDVILSDEYGNEVKVILFD